MLKFGFVGNSDWTVPLKLQRFSFKNYVDTLWIPLKVRVGPPPSLYIILMSASQPTKTNPAPNFFLYLLTVSYSSCELTNGL